MLERRGKYFLCMNEHRPNPCPCVIVGDNHSEWNKERSRGMTKDYRRDISERRKREAAGERNEKRSRVTGGERLDKR